VSRDLHAQTSAALSNSDLQIFHLVTFYFDTEMRLTDHAHDISYDLGAGTETFTSSGRLSSATDVTEDLEMSNQKFTIVLTGANEADIALALAENYNNKRVVVYRGFYDDTGATTDANIIPTPFILFEGTVDSFSINDDPEAGESNVAWKIASHWADWDRVTGRRCNTQNAQAYFADEEGFSHVYDQVGEKTWGRIRS